MIDQDTLKKMESKLALRWPRRSFSATTMDDKQVDFTFDTFATESEEKQIRNYIQKFMGLEFPNYQYKVDRLPF